MRHVFYFKFSIGLLTIALCVFAVSNSQAATYYWDPGLTGPGTGTASGGTIVGTWDAGTTSDWYDGVSSDGLWSSGADAEFDTVGNTVTVDNTGGAVQVHNITFNTTGYTVSGTTLTLVNVATDPTITVTNATDTATINSILDDSTLGVGFTKAGSGTLNINTGNTFGGKVAINGGTLHAKTVTSWGPNPGAAMNDKITMNNVTTLQFDGQASDYDFTGTNEGLTINGTATIQLLGTVGKNARANGPLSGSGTLIKKGTGDTLSLRFPIGVSAFTGTIEVAEGWLDCATATVASGTTSGLNPATTVQVDIGATWSLRNLNTTIAGLNGGGNVVTSNNPNTRSLTFGYNNANGDFSGGIVQPNRNSIPLNKTGTGTQIFRGVSSDVGTLTVVGGTVKMMSGASLASTLWDVQSPGTLDVTDAGYTFLSGQTLEGKGLVKGNITVQGTLGPGESAGLLTVDGNVTLSGNYNEEINGNVAGTSYDQLLVTGANRTVSLGGTLTITDTYTALSSDKLWVVINDNSSTTLAGNFSNYVSVGGAPVAITGIAGLAGFGVYYNADSSTGNLTGGNDVVIAVVPEPATLCMLLMALAAMGGFITYKRRCK